MPEGFTRLRYGPAPLEATDVGGDPPVEAAIA